MADQYIEDDEITLKDLILKIFEFKNLVLKKWKWVVLFSILFGAIFVYNASTTPKEFVAKLTFMVSGEDEGGGMSGMSGLLGQFGFSNSIGKSNPEKMLELIQTRIITEKALFNKAEIDGKLDFLANHMIDNLSENNLWGYLPFYKRWYKEPSSLIGFKFSNDKISEFGRIENKALKKLHKFLTGKTKRLIVSVSELTGIMELEIETTNEALSICILKNMFGELSTYYFDKTVEKQENNYTYIKSKTDSLFSLLSAKENQLAYFGDSRKGLISRVNLLEEKRLERDIQKLMMMYIEASKNLEIAEFRYNNKKPYIQSIDIPIAPLASKRSSKIKGLILGCMIGGFIIILIIILRKIYADIMKN